MSLDVIRNIAEHFTAVFGRDALRLVEQIGDRHILTEAVPLRTGECQDDARQHQ